MAKHHYKPETYEVRKSVGYLIRRSRNLITQELEALFDQKGTYRGLTFAQWAVLMSLRDDLARTPAELCNFMCYDSGALTRLLDHMEERGLLRRRRSTKDRRMVRLMLTAEGRNTINIMMQPVVGFYNELLADFSAKEVSALVILLGRLVDNLTERRKKG